MYENRLLDGLQDAYIGTGIGEVVCAPPACADDVAVPSPEPETLQSLIHISAHYTSLERYELQPAKTVVFVIRTHLNDNQDYVWTLNGETMPVVTESMHVGVLNRR